ncbi:MAG: ATP synthase F1 subunit epsilon [Deltaproteobacteria bacterium]|nr:ATP synthase F1 subunit epsilon [Deltaproteobacteria bacterium]
MKLSVITPKGALVDTEVQEVSGPGVLGEFGVLPKHIPFLSALRPGTLTYKTNDGVQVVAVGAGLLQVASTSTGETVRVLVDNAVAGKQVNREEATRRAAELDKEISGWKGELGTDYQALIARRAWAQAQIDAADRG